MKLHPLVKEIIFNQTEIEQRTVALANEIKQFYGSQQVSTNCLLTIGLLKGCIPFYAHFCMNFDFQIDMEFMVVSSYLGGMKTNGEPKINLDVNTSINGRDILIVEDIIDSGNTLNFVKSYLLNKGAKSVRIVTLLDKPSERVVDIKPDWTGFEVQNGFLIGYGLDYQEKLRNLPYVGLCDTDKLTDWKW